MADFSYKLIGIGNLSKPFSGTSTVMKYALSGLRHNCGNQVFLELWLSRKEGPVCTAESSSLDTSRYAQHNAEGFKADVVFHVFSPTDPFTEAHLTFSKQFNRHCVKNIIWYQARQSFTPSCHCIEQWARDLMSSASLLLCCWQIILIQCSTWLESQILGFASSCHMAFLLEVDLAGFDRLKGNTNLCRPFTALGVMK